MIKEVKTKKNVIMVNKNHERGYGSKQGVMIIEEENGIIFANPGSISLPKNNTSKKTKRANNIVATLVKLINGICFPPFILTFVLLI